MFSPFPTRDIIQMAVAVNVQRSAAQKPVRPLIAANPEQHALFQRARQAYIADCDKQSKECDRRRIIAAISNALEQAPGTLPGNPTDKISKLKAESARWQERAEAGRALTILSNANQQDLSALQPEHHKLYVLCHGSAGTDSVSSPADDQTRLRISSQQLATLLESSGLRLSFQDFRVSSCYSADSRQPQSFEATELAACKKPTVKHVNGKPVLALPFAQRLSLALSNTGYSSPVVSGYHSYGYVYRRFDTTHGCNGVGSNMYARTSAVRAQFGPESPPAPASSPTPGPTPASTPSPPPPPPTATPPPTPKPLLPPIPAPTPPATPKPAPPLAPTPPTTPKPAPLPAPTPPSTPRPLPPPHTPASTPKPVLPPISAPAPTPKPASLAWVREWLQRLGLRW